jgi:two-component system, chemotaxis family, response regulator Rcp1
MTVLDRPLDGEGRPHGRTRVSDRANRRAPAFWNILLVEDSAADVRFTRLALEESRRASRLVVVPDGVEAMRYLRRAGEYQDAPHPHLVLLDLHLPNKNGHEVLAEAKADPGLCSIPMVVLTTSTSEEDLAEAYRLHANCYITKPFDLDGYIAVIQAIEHFWIELAELPGS